METFINDIITMTPSEWWASRDWGKTLIWLNLLWLVLIPTILIGIYSFIKDSNLFQGRTNTIQKVCILLGIIFFFATAGFGRIPEIGAITTGLMFASIVGYFLFKDK
tara:strand:+ start:300 stop:620 length:321 start_codon:yes stop_codon:yes gene_type:complete